ncbi:MAG TPA: hypothetical protein VFX34_09615, partial [Sporosarcina sp.]|nr:hypothetical protein [Sporosarcina sp.]
LTAKTLTEIHANLADVNEMNEQTQVHLSNSTEKLSTQAETTITAEKTIASMHGTFGELLDNFKMFQSKMESITRDVGDIGEMTMTFADLIADSSASLEEVNASIHASVADNERIVGTLDGTMHETRELLSN